MAEFAIKIATDPSEIVEAQRLRFQVFNLELNKGLQRSYENGLDVDEFDPFCHHLIVRDVQSNDVVGTYRMMLGAQARQHLGFYSEKELDLSRIKNLDGELLEIGRSCARKIIATARCCRSCGKRSPSMCGRTRYVIYSARVECFRYPDSSAGRKKLAEDCYNRVLGRVTETNLDQDDEIEEGGELLLPT
jgi:hypothetical protein